MKVIWEIPICILFHLQRREVALLTFLEEPVFATYTAASFAANKTDLSIDKGQGGEVLRYALRHIGSATLCLSRPLRHRGLVGMESS